MLITIQTQEVLNDIATFGAPGPGGAYHNYKITSKSGVPLDSITFQEGPRNERDSIIGVIDTDLLEIVRDRLIAFQAGPYSCRANRFALMHIEEALCHLNARVEDRIKRNTLGRNEL